MISCQMIRYLLINSHSTMYLLKHGDGNVCYSGWCYSHSTMYLLKPGIRDWSINGSNKFTFHHVSIKTWECQTHVGLRTYSHSTMYLLKPSGGGGKSNNVIYSHSTMYLLKHIYFPIRLMPERNSHSTMYLLKLCIVIAVTFAYMLFTFHHVSIKTMNLCHLYQRFPDSHSTMYLLKRRYPAHGSTAMTNSHSTMYLLKPSAPIFSFSFEPSFTFHHVSIKTTSFLSKFYKTGIFTFHHVSIKTRWRFCRRL